MGQGAGLMSKVLPRGKAGSDSLLRVLGVESRARDPATTHQQLNPAQLATRPHSLGLGSPGRSTLMSVACASSFESFQHDAYLLLRGVATVGLAANRSDFRLGISVHDHGSHLWVAV